MQQSLLLPTQLNDRLCRPLHDLRVSVIDRCNFRCTYCMPEAEYAQHYDFLKQQHWLTYDEIERLVRLLVYQGVAKVRITGGEPLLRPRLANLIRRLSTVQGIEDVALTTNGSLLAQYAHDLYEAGLNRITVSLDTLNENTFKSMSGHRGQLHEILSGIDVAEAAGFTKIKFNVVVQRGVNDQHILELVEHFKDSGHILRFIEYMDVGNCNHWKSEFVVPSKEILQRIHARYPVEPIESNYFGEVATRYQFIDGSGEIGFISSVTQPFCGSCTRLRLSTDGKLYTCLFASEGTDLRTALRSKANDETMNEVLQGVWQQRGDRYSEARALLLKSKHKVPKVEMFQIGG